MMKSKAEQIPIIPRAQEDKYRKVVTIESSKTYKKVLCPDYSDKGCKSGDECQKAHGLVEMRDRGK